MPEGAAYLLTTLLEQVSRSFYRTLRLLPGRIRPQVGLAYLLARTSDTIADTTLLPAPERQAALQAFASRIAGSSSAPLALGDLARNQGAEAERILLQHAEQTLSLLSKLDPQDTELIRKVVAIIISGQELDLSRFANSGPKNIVALANDAELEDYTYRVAGCVGEFWTAIARTHLFPFFPLDIEKLMGQAVEFGKGLQLVNILRDIPRDLRSGRCYLPAEALKDDGLHPEQLLDPANETKFRRVYDLYLERAEGYLMAGWDYTRALPRSQVRLRLACALPILIGLRTLSLLRKHNVLDPSQVLKVTRSEVKALLRKAVFYYPSARAWNQLAVRCRARS